MARRRGRLFVLQIVVVSMLTVLSVRLWQVQVVRGEEFVAAATETRTRDVVVPSVRGQILDSAGRPLVRNRSALVVSVDPTQLAHMRDGGDAVLRRLAGVLGQPVKELEQRIRPCGPKISRPCWPGSPYRPIPIDQHVSTREALQILERQEAFSGVTAEVQAVREYPGGVNAAQVLGYLQPVTEEELNRRSGLKAGFSGMDLMGRDGLESVYDDWLRGSPGQRRVGVDRMGKVIGLERQIAPTPGDTLITSIDANVQSVVEKALADAMQRVKGADGAAGVVMDPRNGRVIALASVPSYDPAVWTGGISGVEYERLLSAKAGSPLVSRAIKGQFAPGSTFKLSSVAAMVRDGYPLHGHYECPGSYMVGGRSFHNFHGISMGTIDLHTALVKSCDTIFYRAGYEQWLRDGGMNAKPQTKEPMPNMARALGFGRKTGIDLPGESAGRIPDRAWKKHLWETTKNTSCVRGRTGYPEVAKTDPGRAAFLKRLAFENCVDGYKFWPGEAANLAIGQGDVLVTPLQLATAYSAMIGDGKVRSPRIGWALVSPAGKVVKRIDPPVVGEVPVSKETRDYIRAALSEVPSDGTAAGAFQGFPMNRVKIGGKTGTAEVYGKNDTSWFASFAPAQDPKFVVVVMVSQGGQGAVTAAPTARQIWEGIFGLAKTPAALPAGRPADRPALIRADGTWAP
jgi:penicillin-binding protein 2